MHTMLILHIVLYGDKQHLQNDLEKLVKWYEKLQMLFNYGKCKCLHTGHVNLDINYNIGGTVRNNNKC